MSPPGKRRHNELNAAPPPETPPGNGQAGRAKTQRFCAQRRKFLYSGKSRSFSPQRGSQGKFAAECLTVRALTCPRCAACIESFPLIPHAVVVSLPAAGVKGASPLQLFLFEFFFLRRKKNGEALTQSGNLCCQIKTNLP